MLYKNYSTIPRNKYRLDALSSELSSQNQDFIVFNGIDYKEHDHKFIRKFASGGYGNVCPTSTLSCAISHIALWKHISEYDIDYAIILEDDTCIDMQLYREKAQTSVEAHVTSNIVYLYHDVHLKYPEPFVLSFGCYCLTPKTALALYDYYINNKVIFHIDLQTNFVVRNLGISNKVIDIPGLTKQINGNVSSMGIQHGNIILNLIKGSYIHRVLTTPIIQINNSEIDKYTLVIVFICVILTLINVDSGYSAILIFLIYQIYDVI